MLPSSRRVSKILFEKIMRDSRLVHSPYFSMRIGSLGQEPSRFSFVVSKKVAMRATKRNALRRKGYNATRHVLETIQDGFVILCFAKKGAEALTSDAVTSELRELFIKAGLSS